MMTTTLGGLLSAFALGCRSVLSAAAGSTERGIEAAAAAKDFFRKSRRLEEALVDLSVFPVLILTLPPTFWKPQRADADFEGTAENLTDVEIAFQTAGF